MLLLGIVGHPLTHSLSPLLHNWALRTQKIPGSYHAWDITPEHLESFFQAARILPTHGLSVTIPHKESVMRYLEGISENARGVGAVNTVFWQDGRLWGENTDVAGFMAPLRDLTPGNALILGAGGAARAAIWGLIHAGWEVLVTARTDNRAIQLSQITGAKTLPWENRHQVRPDLLVNTTPLGMLGAFQRLCPWKASLKGIGRVYDLVYNPQITPLIAQAYTEKIPAITGLPMLIAQAEAQFRIWTKSSFAPQEATRLLEQHLRA